MLGLQHLDPAAVVNRLCASRWGTHHTAEDPMLHLQQLGAQSNPPWQPAQTCTIDHSSRRQERVSNRHSQHHHGANTMVKGMS